MFELFAETLGRIPPKAVRKLLKREYETIQDALLHQRIEGTLDIHSILCFCEFMEKVAEADFIFSAVELPAKHVVFYRSIVSQLIAAGEIPETTKAKFDLAFSEGFLRNPAKP